MSPALELLSKPDLAVKIDGKPLPCNSWSVEVGNFGSISSATVSTSIAALRHSGIDIFKLPGDGVALPLDIYGSGKHLFGGAVDIDNFQFHTDHLTISGRDWAAEMVDSKRVLSALKYQNATPDQLAKALGEQYGLDVSRVKGGTNKVKIGTIFKDEAALTTVPQQPWRLLQLLARACQARCYVTPDKELVFEPANNSGINHEFDWMQKPGTNNGNLPLLELELKYQPRRNHSFTVAVMSAHHQTAQKTEGKSVHLGKDLQPGPQGTFTAKVGQQVLQQTFGVNPTVYKSGLWSGFAGKTLTSSLKSAGAKLPSYIFHMPGRTADQCQQIAEAIAADIASHLYIWTATVSGLPEILPFDNIKINEIEPGSLFGKAEGLLSVSAVSHSWSLSYGSALQEGWKTRITALNIPAASSDNLLNAIGQGGGGL